MRRLIMALLSAVLVFQHVMPVAKPPEPVVVPVVVKPVVHKTLPKKEPHPRVIAQRATRSQWRSSVQWKCLDMLWTKESHFNPKARNKKSGAYGIAQFMPQTWENYKVKKTSDPRLQIKYGLRYITKRYGSPCAAWKHSKKHGWY